MYIVSCLYAYNILQRYLSIYILIQLIHIYIYIYAHSCIVQGLHMCRHTHNHTHTQTMHFISDCITRVARNQESAELDEQDR